MASLPAGIRRVYNTFYKRKATGAIAYAPTPTEIREYFESVGLNIDEIDDQQFNQVLNYFEQKELMKQSGQLSRLVNEIEQTDQVEDSNETEDLNESDKLSSLALSDSQLKQIVTNQAAQMQLELSSSDIELVASQIDNIDATLNEVLAETEELLCAYADHKKRESLDKVNAMFNRISRHVDDTNQDTSKQISQGLQNFGRDLERSQQNLKSSVIATLQRLRIPSKAT